MPFDGSVEVAKQIQIKHGLSTKGCIYKNSRHPGFFLSVICEGSSGSVIEVSKKEQLPEVWPRLEMTRRGRRAEGRGGREREGMNVPHLGIEVG